MKKILIPSIVYLAFDKLTFDDANRFIDRKQVEVLKAKILKSGRITRSVLVVKMYGKYIIVDGQHLATAIYELLKEGKISLEGEGIECRVYPCANDEEKIAFMRELNTNTNGWKTKNHIETNVKAKTKYTQYFKVLKSVLEGAKLIHKNSKGVLNIQDSLVWAILADTDRHTAKDKIEGGNFVIPNRAKSNKIMDYVYALQRVGFTCNSRPNNEALINFISDKMKKGLYNHSLMIKNIRKATKDETGKIILSSDVKKMSEQIRKLHESKKELVLN